MSDVSHLAQDVILEGKWQNTLRNLMVTCCPEKGACHILKTTHLNQIKNIISLCGKKTTNDIISNLH